MLKFLHRELRRRNDTDVVINVRVEKSVADRIDKLRIHLYEQDASVRQIPPKTRVAREALLRGMESMERAALISRTPPILQ